MNTMIHENNLIPPRKVSKSTPLRAGLLIAAPRSFGTTMLEPINQWISGDSVTWVHDPSPEILYHAERPILLIGNLADNRCVQHLYWQLLCMTDLHYPGPGGYEIRTLLDPFASGHNIIHLGYSDPEGCKRGIHSMTQTIREAVERSKSDGETAVQELILPYFDEVHATQTVYTDARANQIIADKYNLDDPTAHYTAISLEDKGFLAYLTGNKSLLCEFETAMRSFLNTPYVHLKLQRRVQIWRLLEATGLMSDQLAHEYANHFYHWANDEEGIDSILSKHYQSPTFPRQNHGLYPAFGLLLLCDYYEKYYPHLKDPSRWSVAAERVFSFYNDGAWKPLCDGLCHGWWMSQPIMLDYALFEKNHAYLVSRGAQKAAECAIACINNEGWLPAAGDAVSGSRQFPHMSLDVAAHYYQDGRYRYMAERSPYWRRGYSGANADLPRTFSDGVEMKEPSDLIGVTVVPMDPPVYHAWQTDADMARFVADTPPSIPLDRCFDKLAVRSGLAVEDDFLLIDGLGGGSHSYADSMAILDYASHGISLIIAEDNLIYNEVGGANTLTVFRNGESAPMPAYAEFIGSEKLDHAGWMTQIKLHDMNGADWTRTYILVTGKALIVHDAVTANESGVYTVATHYRLPGMGEVQDGVYHSQRRNERGQTYDIRLFSEGSKELQIHLSSASFTDHMYRSLPGETLPVDQTMDPVYYLQQRFHLLDDELYLQFYEARTKVDMTAGDAFAITTWITIDQNEPASLLDLLNAASKSQFTESAIKQLLPPGYCKGKPDSAVMSPVKQHHIVNEPSFELHEITGNRSALAHHADDVILGTDSGEIIHVDKNGRTQSVITLPAEILSLACNDDYIIAGTADAGLYCITHAGNMVWQIKIKRISTWFPWWETNLPNCYALVLGRYKGHECIAAGCGDDSVHFYDMEGNLIGNHYMDTTGVPSLILSADVNQDGKNEFVIACDFLSCTSQVDIVDEQGKRLARFGNEGWVSVSSVVSTYPWRDRIYVIHGKRQRRNIQVHAFDKHEPGEMMQPIPILIESIAGPLNAAKADIGLGLFAVASNEGCIKAFNLDGEALWTHIVAWSPTDIVFLNDSIVIGGINGQACVLTKEGHLVTEAITELQKPYFVQNEGATWAFGLNGFQRLA